MITVVGRFSSSRLMGLLYSSSGLWPAESTDVSSTTLLSGKKAKTPAAPVVYGSMEARGVLRVTYLTCLSTIHRQCL